MAAPTGTFTRYGVIGDREDLADAVYDISPTDTVFLSNAKRGKATNTLHEWQTDALAAAAANSQIEGDDPGASTAAATTRYGNYTNISWKVPRVTGTLRAMDTAGRADEYAYQIAKRTKELKRDIETVLLANAGATAGVAASARVSAGAGTWLWNNVVALGTAATTVTVTSGVPTTAVVAGTATAWTEGNLKTVLAACWDDGGDPNLIMVGSFNKQFASGLSGIATQYRDNQGMGPAVIIGSADVYVSDFGQLAIVANRFQPAGNVYVFDMEYWSVDYLRPFQKIDLSKTGDSDRCMILAEYTLAALAPLSSGKIYSTTTS